LAIVKPFVIEDRTVTYTMTITRRGLLKALEISGAALSSAGCLAFDDTAANETLSDTNAQTEAPAGTDTQTEAPTATAGWAAEIPEKPPEVSCAAVSRPMAEPVNREGALAPREYPGPPPSEPANEAAVEYATAFELAYRQNGEMRANTDVTTDGEPDSYLTRFDISIQNSWAAAGPSDSVVVRLQYIGSGTIHPNLEFDYITQYVTYYIDSTRIVRARTTQYDLEGIGALNPDPWADGTPVACFEG
jgi:hypothetical protein